MDHATVATAATFLNRVKKNREVWITQALSQTDNLMFVLKEKDRLTLPLFGMDNCRALFRFLDKVVNAHAEGTSQFDYNFN